MDKREGAEIVGVPARSSAPVAGLRSILIEAGTP
jgi:hypothetical protein